MEKITVQNFGTSTDAKKAGQWYSVFASGAGIFGLGSRVYADDAVFAAYDPAKADRWTSRTSTTSTAASTTSARRSTSPRSSSPSTGCTRWCRT